MLGSVKIFRKHTHKGQHLPREKLETKTGTHTILHVYLTLTQNNGCVR